MHLKTVNGIFGYGYLAVGASKCLFTILLLLQMFTNVNIALNGGDGTNYGYYPTVSLILGGAQFFLAIGSIIMIYVNSTTHPSVIPGYLWGLGAVLLELITGSMMIIYILVVFFECGMYVKAGQKIINDNEKYKDEYAHKTGPKPKNPEWYYGKRNEQNEYVSVEKQQRMEKLEKELEEWKQLLDDGEIDEETYNQETSKLIEKVRKKNERSK